MLFPITCVDNFYSEPDKIREYALSLDYSREDGGNYPGVRTEQLHILNPEFFNFFCKKLFSLFYNFEQEKINWVVDCTFQKIYSYDCHEFNKQDINSGWIHVDNDIIFAGVVYLNPIPNLDSGTSIYKFNENYDKTSLNFSTRKDFYNHRKKFTEEEYVKEKKTHNSKFHKTLEIKNVYNRMISYDSSYWHNQSGFLIDSEDFRLTQVFFVKSIECSSTPYLRCKKYEF